MAYSTLFAVSCQIHLRADAGAIPAHLPDGFDVLLELYGDRGLHFLEQGTQVAIDGCLMDGLGDVR